MYTTIVDTYKNIQICGIFILPLEPWNAEIASLKITVWIFIGLTSLNTLVNILKKSLKSAKNKSINIFEPFFPIKDEYKNL